MLWCGAQKNDGNINVAGVFAFRGIQLWSLSDCLIYFDYEKKAVEWWKHPVEPQIIPEIIKYEQLNDTTEPIRAKDPMVCAISSEVLSLPKLLFRVCAPQFGDQTCHSVKPIAVLSFYGLLMDYYVSWLSIQGHQLNM